MSKVIQLPEDKESCSEIITTKLGKVLSSPALQFILLQVSECVCNILAFPLLSQILLKY